MYTSLLLPASLAAIALAAPQGTTDSPSIERRVDPGSFKEFPDYCRRPSPDPDKPFYLDAKKWQDLGVGPFCASEYASSADFGKKSYQRVLLGKVIDSEDFYCPINCDASKLENDKTCGDPKNPGPTVLSAGFAICLGAYSNYNKYLAALQLYFQNARFTLLESVDKIATDFSPTVTPKATSNKFTKGSGIAAMTAAIVGAIPAIGGPAAAIPGIAGGAMAVVNSQLTTYEPETRFQQAANISQATGIVFDGLSQALLQYQDDLNKNPPDTTGPDGKTYTGLEYVEQPWSVPSIFTDGKFAHPDSATLPVNITTKALQQALTSIVINYAWTQAKVIVLKFDSKTGDALGWKGNPCDPDSGVPMFGGAVWCDNNPGYEAAYLLQTYVEADPVDTITPEKENLHDPIGKSLAQHTVPGFGNLTDPQINIAYSDVIQSAFNNYVGAGKMQQTFAPTTPDRLSQIMHNLQPHNWMAFNLPVCDLTDPVTGSPVWPEANKMPGDLWLQKQMECRCWQMPGWPYKTGDPKDRHSNPAYCDYGKPPSPDQQAATASTANGETLAPP